MLANPTLKIRPNIGRGSEKFRLSATSRSAINGPPNQRRILTIAVPSDQILSFSDSALVLSATLDEAKSVCAQVAIDEIFVNVHHLEVYAPVAIKELKSVLVNPSNTRITAMSCGPFPGLASQLKQSGADVVLR